MLDLHKMLEETYICCLFLDPGQPGDDVHVMVKHPSLEGFDVMPNLVVPRVKHLSVNTMQPLQKQIKKQKEIRTF